MKRNAQIILALDVDNEKKALHLVRLLYPKIKTFKVGLQLYTACGAQIIQKIRKIGAGVFLDLKFNDIPNTMVQAVRGALKYRVGMLTVHTLSGPQALREVAKASRNANTKILGVTILTSICPHFLKDLGINKTVPQEVLYLAKMAKRCGLDGVVSSPQEAGMVRKNLGNNFLIVTPGIRPATAGADDQKRIATPQAAAKAGSDFLVIGRPITEAKDPLSATKKILDSLYVL